MAFTILARSSLAVRAKPLTTPTCKVGLKQKQNSVQFRDITGLKDKGFAIIESFHVLAKIKDMFYLIHFLKKSSLWFQQCLYQCFTSVWAPGNIELVKKLNLGGIQPSTHTLRQNHRNKASFVNILIFPDLAWFSKNTFLFFKLIFILKWWC